MTTMPDFSSDALYDHYRVKIQFRDRVCGGMPKNPDLLEGWIATKTEHKDEITDKQVKEAREALLEPTEEKSWITFPGDERGLYLQARQVKALFKESGTMLRVTEQKRGSKQIFQHGFEIKSLMQGAPADRIYLMSDGKHVKKPTAYAEGPIHVQTPQGPRTALKRVDYVERPVLEFEIWVLRTEAAEKRHVGQDEIVKMLTFGQENGVGADRSQGHGKFDVLEFEAIESASAKAKKKAS
jgi:hypothetical protein